MKRVIALAAIVALAGTTVVATTALADRGDGKKGGAFRAKLTGYEEIIPAGARLVDGALQTTAEGGAVSTTGHGRFEARLRNDPLRLEYRLTWQGLVDPPGDAVPDVLFSHIHFGQRHTVGGVSAFLCGGGGKAACPDGGSGTFTGVIVPADVTAGAAAQGIAAGEFEELVRAMRAGATYVNLHTSTWPSGEIRGQIRGKHRGFGD